MQQVTPDTAPADPAPADTAPAAPVAETAPAALRVITLPAARHTPLTEARVADLAQSLTEAAASAAVAAVVLTGDAPGFCTGPDPAALTADDLPLIDALRALALQIETLGKPVVAALSGRVEGAGLELALAATARVADRATRVGLRDLRLGLPPALGATQRLPPLIGAAPALEMMLTARPFAAGDEALAPLWHRLTEGDPLPEARALAARLGASPATGPDTDASPRGTGAGLGDPLAYQAEIARQRAAVASHPLPAARAIVTAVEAALLVPHEAALDIEAVHFRDAFDSAESAALRHLARAERRASLHPDLAGQTPRRFGHIAVVGGGATAAGVVARCLDAGLEVTQFERGTEALDAARARVAAQPTARPTARPAGHGATAGGRMARWHGTTALADLHRADLIIEAVAEVPETKRRVFAALAEVAGPETILVTQSGLLSIAPMATAAGALGGRVAGLHLHGPIAQARLAEVIAGPQSSALTRASLAAFARRDLGLVALHTGTGGGALAETVLAAARDAGLAMLAEGVPLLRIDEAMTGWGLKTGLFLQMDMTGLDPLRARGRLLARQSGAGFAHLDALDRLADAGRSGRAAGQGFYRWSADGRAESPSDDLFALLFETPPPEPLPLRADLVRMRVIAAMANAAARAVRLGHALRPSDIDLALVLGQGFPRLSGGPVHTADQAGLYTLLPLMRRLAEVWPALYQPDPLLLDLIRNGRGFAALNV